MAVTLKSTQGYDIVGGSQDSNIKAYSVSVDATTQNPANYLGGTSRASVEVNAGEDVFLAFNEETQLADSASGINFKGDISAVSESNFFGISLTLDSQLARLNVDGNVTPSVSVPLATVVNKYLAAGKVTGISLSSPFNPTATVPGFKGNLLDGLKQVLSAYAAMLIDSEDGTLYLRSSNEALATGTVNLPRNVSDVGRNVSAQSPVHKVEVEYFQWEPVTNRQVYPYSLESPTPITVSEGEVQNFEFVLNASLTSVVQPKPYLIIDINSGSFDSTSGYVVTDNIGAPVAPAEWTAFGGRVTVELTAHDTIQVVVVGMREGSSTEGPYRIAMVHDNVEEPALFITGTGMRSNKDSVGLYTGTAKASEGSVQTVTNPNISSVQQAYDRGQWAVSEAALNQTFDFATDTNLSAGDRVRVGHVVYRIVGKTISTGLYKYSAIMETSMRDFNNAFASGTTIAQFNSLWGSRKFLQASVDPLKGA